MRKLTNTLLEKNLIPDILIRYGIRSLLQKKLDEETRLLKQLGAAQKLTLVNFLKASPIAVNTKEANQQHYEVPTEFFKRGMGRHMKYSSGLWEKTTDFDQSEEDMLILTAQRAQLQDGQAVLELGCGWGSLSLFMAARFPNSQITGVSNSATQKKYIETEARKRRLNNLRIITADMNDFTINDTFDRIVSVEMFEHMRNYQKLLSKVSSFLKEDGKLFVHIFTHKDFAYLYKEQDESDWIARYFFTGGIMPSDDLFAHFDDHLIIEQQWRVSGVNYQKTSEAWLANMDRHKKEIMPIIKDTYGDKEATKWWVYWRVFFMSCAELWGYQQGQQWMVSHYIFKKRS